MGLDTGEKTVYLLPSMKADVESFKEEIEKAEKMNEEVKNAQPPSFFQVPQEYPGNIKSWQDKSRFVFKLLERKPEKQEKNEDEDENNWSYKRYKGLGLDEELERANELIEKEERKNPTKKEPVKKEESSKIMEIDDDDDLEKLEKKEQDKKNEENDKEWTAYFEQRKKYHDKLKENIQKEDLEDYEEGVLYKPVFENVDFILKQTTLSQEHKDLIKHSIIPIGFEPSWEDFDQLRSFDSKSRIYSLIDKRALDFNFTFHHRTRYSSIEYHASLSYKFNFYTAKSLSDVSNYRFDRIPRFLFIDLFIEKNEFTFIFIFFPTTTTIIITKKKDQVDGILCFQIILRMISELENLSIRKKELTI